MQTIIPCFYSTYGRYINKFRAIPYNIDGLKPVERRILLTAYEVARNKLTKSAKLVGHALATYHPHGDLSVYGTMIKMVEGGYLYGDGNWGSKGISPDTAAAYRYTECKLEKWVEELAFKYIKYVPWENLEFENEPIALPSPIPLGLIGVDVIFGISFYRTLIPKYKLKDLATRLSWLLQNPKPSVDQLSNEDTPNEVLGPIITPNFRNCHVQEMSPRTFLSLLIYGEGTIKAVPFGKIDKKVIVINGQVPGSNFDKLTNAATFDSKTKKRELEVNIVDVSANMDDRYALNIEVQPLKRNVDLPKLATKIWENYLMRNVHFACYYSDDVGKLNIVGIDDILLNNYTFWKTARLNKMWTDLQSTIKVKFENHIIEVIRNIIINNPCNSIDQIIQIYEQTCNGTYQTCLLDSYDETGWIFINTDILPDHIRDVASKKTIKQLIEYSIDLNKLNSTINNQKKEIENIEQSSLDVVNSLK